MPAVMHHVGSRGKRKRSPTMSEINVTPFVDVMLVLLIVFMVTAPLLAAGVPVDLPQAAASPLALDKAPVTVTVKVESKVQYPSGSKKKPKPELVCAEEVLEQLQQAMEDPNRLGQLGGAGRDGAPPAANMDE
jgi:biopolymer transport protein ExbD